MTQPEPKAALPEKDPFEVQAEFTRVMGNVVRLKILHHLHGAQSAMSSAELLNLTGVSKTSLSQHLSKMSSVGLIRTHYQGRYLMVELACPEIGMACDIVRGILAKIALVQAASFER